MVVIEALEQNELTQDTGKYRKTLSCCSLRLVTFSLILIRWSVLKVLSLFHPARVMLINLNLAEHPKGLKTS